MKSYFSSNLHTVLLYTKIKTTPSLISVQNYITVLLDLKIKTKQCYFSSKLHHCLTLHEMRWYKILFLIKTTSLSYCTSKPKWHEVLFQVKTISLSYFTSNQNYINISALFQSKMTPLPYLTSKRHHYFTSNQVDKHLCFISNQSYIVAWFFNFLTFISKRHCLEGNQIKTTAVSVKKLNVTPLPRWKKQKLHHNIWYQTSS